MDIPKSDKKAVFTITIKDIQKIARKHIGRKLTNDEMSIVIKGLEAGLSFDIDTVITTAIEEAIS